MKIEFNEQEANALIELLNVAVQAKGIGVAEAALHLTKKIQDASIPVQKVENTEKKK